MAERAPCPLSIVSSYRTNSLLGPSLLFKNLFVNESRPAILRAPFAPGAGPPGPDRLSPKAAGIRRSAEGLAERRPGRPTHGDAAHLAEEVVSGTVDAAFVTLPLLHPDLRIEEWRRDRLVVCLRRDDPLATKASLQTADLQGNLAVLYHPQPHPDAHERLLELLRDAGLQIQDYSCASHPSEMQTLVKGGTASR